ncbi:major facilitator superfamily domain-containing protein [Catenaria anguillulae PL171]|uniref:Major facilitator superfamily domain-containing protein n=1 Tax=Catenaria anguillulae PL171 TaxID=765915 RepID=A0A1Y2HW34_9FUNG|nr:major facilitator superfamily domain-containing protein [Catenaria anguillulae PL171]
MGFSAAFEGFTAVEKRNLFIYMVGICGYKFALETLSGCMGALVQTRTKISPAATWATVLSFHFICQGIGSFLLSPLMKRWPTSRVLAVALFCYGVLVAIIPILEGTTGGGSTGLGDERNYQPGTFDITIVYYLWPVIGIFSGVVETIRRVIPRDIVGGDARKLKAMDSTVHIAYEIVGTTGALLSRYWIAYFNYAYAVTIVPVVFAIAAVVALRILPEPEKLASTSHERKPLLREAVDIFVAFFKSVWIGVKLTMMNRCLVWLTVAYSFALVLHRYLENTLMAHYATFGLGTPSYQQLILAGSNFGEAMGAVVVLNWINAVPTPIPWLRSDALTLLAVWVFPLATPFANTEGWVWFLAGLMAFISSGWSAGDVSLIAYIQGRLDKIEGADQTVSPLGSVASFLFVLHIAIFYVCNRWAGGIQDSYMQPLLTEYKTAKNIPKYLGLAPTQQAMFWTCGVFLTISAGVVLLSTFIPKGSFAFNPKEIEEESDLKQLAQQLDGEEYAVVKGNDKESHIA